MDIVKINDYIFCKDDGVNRLIGYNGKEESLILPESFRGETYIIDSYAFYLCKCALNIIIPDSVTSIRDNAFFGCLNLVRIVLGKNVTSIGRWAFAHCHRLVEVINKSKLDIVKGSVDNGVVALYALKVKRDAQSEIVKINDYLFYTAEGINYLISYVGNETSLVLPDSFRGETYVIHDTAFYDCTNLVSVELGKGITKIGDDAFADCQRLVEVINKSKLDIVKGSKDNGDVAYYALKVKRDAQSEIVKINDYLFYTVEGINYLISYVGKETSLVLPDSFKGETYIIHDKAFNDCTNLVSVVIPDGVTSIGEWAFDGCAKLIRIVIGKNVEKIGTYAFMRCFKIIEVINKSKLDIVKGSDDNGEVSYYALNIKTEFESDIVNVNDYLFYTAGGINYLIAYIGKETSLVLPDNFLGKPYEIYHNAFTNNIDLRSVIIPDNITSVGDSAFYKCRNLESVVIGKGIKKIGNQAFLGCINLTNVIIPDSVTNIGKNAFTYCKCLTNIVIPNSVTSLGPSSFYRCSNLTRVVISSSVTSIGVCTFQVCSNLRSIVIPNSVESIDSSAFFSCDNLNHVYYLGTPGEWNDIKNLYSKEHLIEDTRYYYSESKPSNNEHKYWHYVDGNPTKW